MNIKNVRIISKLWYGLFLIKDEVNLSISVSQQLGWDSEPFRVQ